MLSMDNVIIKLNNKGNNNYPFMTVITVKIILQNTYPAFKPSCCINYEMTLLQPT